MGEEDGPGDPGRDTVDVRVEVPASKAATVTSALRAGNRMGGGNAVYELLAAGGAGLRDAAREAPSRRLAASTIHKFRGLDFSAGRGDGTVDLAQAAAGSQGPQERREEDARHIDWVLWRDAAELQLVPLRFEVVTDPAPSIGVSSGSAADSDMEHLLRERNSIQSSMNMTTNILGQADDIHADLRNQRRTLTGVGGTVLGIAQAVPGLNKLIENIRKKRNQDDKIVMAVIASCILFTLWYLFG